MVLNIFPPTHNLQTVGDINHCFLLSSIFKDAINRHRKFHGVGLEIRMLVFFIFFITFTNERGEEPRKVRE